MFCSKCGNQCKEGTKFCDKCGALLVVKDAPMKKKTKMPVLVISISAIVLALILATFIFLFFLIACRRGLLFMRKVAKSSGLCPDPPA